MVNDDGTSGRGLALCSEQRGVVWMKDVIRKVLSPGQTVLDNSAVTFVTGMPCMLLPRPLRFVGCEIYTICFKESFLRAVGVFVREIIK